jgi:hypothetical protein
MLDFRTNLKNSTLTEVLKRQHYPLGVMLLWQPKRRYFFCELARMDILTIRGPLQQT